MTDNQSVQASVNRKRRKEVIERKRNKKQYINAENEIKDRKIVARHKRYLILKQKEEEAKRPITNNYVMHQQYTNGSSSIDVETKDNNSETSSSDEDIEEKYVTAQVNNSQSSNSGEIWNFGKPIFKC
jgi:hypothetical protein